MTPEPKNANIINNSATEGHHNQQQPKLKTKDVDKIEAGNDQRGCFQVCNKDPSHN